MRPFGLIGAALLLGGCGPSSTGSPHSPVPASAPKRIVSINLCSDQLLLALADRSQIAGLTVNARDPGMSAAAGAARRVPAIRSTAEELLHVDPDLVVGMPASGSAPLAAIGGARYPLLDLQAANRLDDIYAAIRQTAAATGYPARGDALVAEMEHGLAAIPKPGHGRVAAYYQRRGYMTGTGTLIDEMMTRIGLVNLAAKIGKPPLSQLSLEEMVAANPDFLIVESATDRVNDQGSEMLHHPALRHIPRLGVPQAWTVCGGPAYVRAVRTLAGQILRHDGGPA